MTQYDKSGYNNYDPTPHLMNRPYRTITATLLLVLLLLAPAAHGETVFVATIDGASNIPPRSVVATGMATFTLNNDQTELAYHVTYQDLSSLEDSAHLHNGGPREQGGIVFALPVGTPKVGVWNIPPDMVTELFAGRIYINIHSVVYIGGEIRGNIMQQVATEASTWGSIKAFYR